jgi:hypothetical protein
MTNRLARHCFLIVTIVLLYIFNSNAQNANDALRLAYPGLGSNARALGMGNAYIGLSDDASASFFNPAGLGLLKRMEFSGGLDYTSYSNNATLFGNTTDASNSTTRLDRVSFAFPFPTLRGSLVFGLTYHAARDYTSRLKFDGFNNGNNSMIQNLAGTDIPFDLYLADPNNNTPIHGMLNQSGDILTSGSVNYWTFSGAVEVYKNVFIGANLNIATGSYNNNNDYYEDDTKGNYQGRFDPTDSTNPNVDFQTFYLNRILKWNISGWNAKVGLLYQLNDMARFGLTIQFPKNFTIKEDFTVNGSSQFASATYNLDPNKYSDNVKYDITTPYELGAGFSINYQGLIFSGQATLVDYSQLEFSNGEGFDPTYFEDVNKNIKDQLGSVVDFNLGAEYTVPRVGLRVRAGYFMQPSAYIGDPTSFAHQYFTAGLGFLAQQTIGFDVAFAHGWWDNYGDNYGVNLSRTNQKITDNKLMFTVTYRF